MTLESVSNKYTDLLALSQCSELYCQMCPAERHKTRALITSDLEISYYSVSVGIVSAQSQFKPNFLICSLTVFPSSTSFI